MGPDRKSFSDLLRESISQEISCLQEHPNDIVASFEANERVAKELGLGENLSAVATFLVEKLGLRASVISNNLRPEIINPGTMMTIVEGEPEYVLELEWTIDGRDKSFRLVVDNRGGTIRIIRGEAAAELIESHEDGKLDYEGVHNKIQKQLHSELDSAFALVRSALRGERLVQAKA